MNIEQQYLSLLKSVKGQPSRPVFNSDLTIQSVLGVSLKHDWREGFPVYKSKFVYWKGAIAEMLWFLSGKSNIGGLRKMGVKIWDDWAYDYFCKSADNPWDREYFFHLIDKGSYDINIPLHYPNITSWQGTALNQTKWVLDNLPKKPFRKSYLVDLWDPTTVYSMAEESGNESVALPACHFAHQVICKSDDKLSLIVYIRSNDLFLGNPFNVAQYAALQQMYCHCLYNRTGRYFVPDELAVLVGDAHVYSNHLEAIDEQLVKATLASDDRPSLTIKNRGQVNLTDFVLEDFQLDNYKHMGKIRADLHVAGGY